MVDNLGGCTLVEETAANPTTAAPIRAPLDIARMCREGSSSTCVLPMVATFGPVPVGEGEVLQEDDRENRGMTVKFAVRSNGCRSIDGTVDYCWRVSLCVFRQDKTEERTPKHTAGSGNGSWSTLPHRRLLLLVSVFLALV